MPTELQIIRASEFVRVGPQGDFDLEASQLVLSQLAAACRRRGISRALLDLRSLQPEPVPIFSPTDLATLIGTFRRIGFSEQDHLAVLYTVDPHHRARMFAFIGKLRGWAVSAFDNFEHALAWLSDGPVAEESTTSAGQAERIPVATVSSEKNRARKSKPRAAKRKRSKRAGQVTRSKSRNFRSRVAVT